MISKKWRGSYKYDKTAIGKIIGFDHTNFEIEFIFSDDIHFTGTVKDDRNTGGTPGTGEVSGTVIGDEVRFVKKMPVMTVIIGGSYKTDEGRKHPNIHYAGSLSADSKSMSGKWKIRFGVGFWGILPCIWLPITGTWSASSQD
jgi:hypothetical protein